MIRLFDKIAGVQYVLRIIDRVLCLEEAELPPDNDAPTLTLVSPLSGYATVKRPSIIVSAADTGWSGVNPDTYSVIIDGVSATIGLSWEENEGGIFHLIYIPDFDLTEGEHTIIFSVADHNGNVGYAAISLIVDTVPPVMLFRLPDSRRIVDWETFPVEGEAADAVSGVERVEVTINEMVLSVPFATGRFSLDVPLVVGLNILTVSAYDTAGLSSTLTFRVLRLVTDRTQADTDRILDLCRRGYDHWTAEERDWWANTPCRRGSYDASDLNRVDMAMDWISAWLEEYGYACDYAPRSGLWTNDNAMTRPEGDAYLGNVEAIRRAAPVLAQDTPQTPESLWKLKGMQGIQAANDIEAILVAVDAVRPKIDISPWLCGEILCGEF